jgi:oxygen-independent coproporphyrinogen-3 oxidase
VVESTVVAGEDAAHEYLLMGMRTVQGVDLAHLRCMTGKPINRQQLDYLISDGLVCLSGDETAIVATRAGRQVLNSVIEHIAFKILQ